jgi:hypothetical protein
MVATVAAPENKGSKNSGEEGGVKKLDAEEPHSPLIRRSVQISVLLRAVNIRRRIKLTWKVGRGRKRGKGQIILGLTPDLASLLPAQSAQTYCGGWQRLRSVTPVRAPVQTVTGWVQGKRCPKPQGLESGPQTRTSKQHWSQTHVGLSNSQATEAHPPVPTHSCSPPSPSFGVRADSTLIQVLGALWRGQQSAALTTSPQTTVPQAWGSSRRRLPYPVRRPGGHRAGGEAAGREGRELPAEQSPQHALLTPRADKRSLRGCRSHAPPARAQWAKCGHRGERPA